MYTTYDIFDDILGLRNDISRFFREVPVRTRSMDLPYANVYERGDEIEIHALTPGVKVEDLNLELIDNSLVIEGEKKSDYSEKPYIRKERSFGRFKKSIRLPFRVNPDNVQASIKNGVLVVKLVKSEDAKPRRIEIR